MIKRKLIDFSMVICGLVLLFISIVVLPKSDASSFLKGMGLSISIAGVFKQLYLAKANKEVLKQQKINREDERYQQLRGKSGYFTFYVTMFMFIILAVIFIFMDYQIPSLLAIGAMLAQIATFFIALVYYDKKI